MIGWIRTLLAFSMVALATPFLLVLQFIALRTGLWSDRLVPPLWHGLVTRAVGFRIHVHGEISEQRPLMIASNHISWTDIMVLGSIARVHFISKSELAGWPVIGLLARYQRTVFVERERRGQSGEQTAEIATRLAAGDPMVLFAEGSTADGNHLLPFKSTLFGAASKAITSGAVERVFIQPVTIAYTRLHGMPMGRQHRTHAAWIGDRMLVPHILALLREGAVDVEVHFGKPVEFDASSKRKAIAAEVEAEVRAKFNAALAAPRRSK
ncbi:MAG: lysophospholipid acyltransferase family protein [Mesorhizobium sp.]|nr:lysophospholipid acyltransferase family protein [Mesorhizobium sp.]